MREMKRERWSRIRCTALTIPAALSLLLCVLVALLVVRSYWRSDHVWVHSGNQWSEYSSAQGRFFRRVWMILPERLSPFEFDKDWGWESDSPPAGFVQNMRRQRQQFGVNPSALLGFQAARGDPTPSAKGRVWLRFAEGPLWPALVAFAILPACWLWRRSSWSREQQHRATRMALLTTSIPMAVPAVLLVLLFINFRCLGPREKPLYGRTSHPAVPLACDPNRTAVKIMTYNIRLGGAYRGGWRFEKPQRVAEHLEEIGALIRQQDPDLVFLQEVVIESGPGSLNQVRVLAQKTGMHAWAFGQCVNDGLPFYRLIEGNAILSRGPMEPLANQKMAGHRAFYELAVPSQSTLWCRARLGGQDVLLASVHIQAGYGESRPVQVQQLLDFTADRPAVLAGDFNRQPNNPGIQRIAATGRFVAKLDGPFTISSYQPHAIIDYVFVPKDWQLLEHRVIPTDLSDHLPVVSTYRAPVVTEPRRYVPAEGRGRQ
jgi:endonuclease/exonuclease/phosphatase family metal-dependent hydrolase